MSNKYGILHLVDPAEVQTADEVTAVARGLSPTHYEVTVAGPLPAALRRRLSRYRVKWVNLPLPAGGSLASYIRGARQVRRLLQSKRVDLIHAHTLSAALTALLARGLGHSNPPVLCTLYGTSALVNRSGASGWLRRQITRWVFAHCNSIIVHSEAERGVVQAVSPQAAQAAQVVHPAVSLAGRAGVYDVGVKRRQLGLQPDAAIVGLLGVPTVHETARSFLQAAALVSAALPNVEFAIIGAGEQRARLKELAHNLGIGGACIFLDNRRDIGEIVIAVNVLVLLTDAGGAPAYGLTALVADIPVIAADMEVLVEILGDLPGVRIVDTNNVETLTVALTELLQVVPSEESEFEVISATGARLRSQDLLVSQQSYDLGKKWATSPSAAAGEASPAQAVLRRYGVRNLVAEVEIIYQQALK